MIIRGNNSNILKFIFWCPFIYNFREIYQILDENLISFKISDFAQLANKLDSDFENKIENKIKNSMLIKDIEEKTLTETMSCLNNFLNENI